MRTTRFTARFALVLCFGLAVSTVRAQIVSTLAGSGALGATDAAGAAASFNNPLGICSDAVGNLYIADWSNNRIRKITPAGGVSTFAGNGAIDVTDATGTAARFYGPSGICADSAGNLYVTDTGNHRIRKITPAGVVTTLAGSGTATFADGTGTAAGFNSPMGVCIDAAGNLYVADTGNQRIRTISPAGLVTTLAGSGTAGYADGTGASAGFNSPIGICSDAAGNLYVTDMENNRIRKITSAGVVSTLAGSGNYAFADGTSTAASFYKPFGVCMDAAGNLYVADTGNNRIRIITPVGVVTTLAGSGAMGGTDGTGTAASFYGPSGICVDMAGNLYVADTSNYRIRKIILPSPVTTFAGSGAATFADGTGTAASFLAPRSICVDAAGNLYVADTGNQRIRKITPAGLVTTLAGSGAPGYADGTGAAASFINPSGICVDMAGNLYVADTGNYRIRKITPAGVVTTFAGSGTATGYADGPGAAARFNFPTGICADTAGNLYVSDTGNYRIRKITPAGDVTTLAGSGVIGGTDATGTAASFKGPSGICADSAGNLYVADPANNRIRKITPAGVVTTFAGSGNYAFADGSGTAAGFNSPFGVCIDAAGNLYVADTYNQRIRMITPAGGVTTLAGSATAGYADGTGTAAGFNKPQGICIDAAGNLYVADTSNNRIRKTRP